MDRGRAADLAELHQKMNDTSLTYRERARADKAFKKIREQAKNKQLSADRERMIKARRVGDEAAAEKISLYIKEKYDRQRL